MLDEEVEIGKFEGWDALLTAMGITPIPSRTRGRLWPSPSTGEGIGGEGVFD